MYRLCFLLLTVLFSLQLFAGMLTPVTAANVRVAAQSAVPMSFGSAPQFLSCVDSIAFPEQALEALADPAADQVVDAEEPVLPVSLIVKSSNGQSFSHAFVHVIPVTSVFVDLLRPPSIVAV